MKKETVGLTVSMMLLFGVYLVIQNHYMQKQQKEMQRSNQFQVNSVPNTKVNEAPVALENNQKINPSLHGEFTRESQETNKLNTQNNSVATSAVNEPLLPVNVTDLKTVVPYATVNFTEVGGCLGENFLSKEHVAYNDNSPVSVVENDNICKAFGFRIAGQDLRQTPAAVTKTVDGSTVITQRNYGVEVKRTFTFSSSDYNGQLKIEVKNLSQSFQNTSVDMELGATSDTKDAGGMFSNIPHQFHGVALRLGDGTIKREYTPFDSNPEYKSLMNEAAVIPTWITVDSLYWMNTLIPQFQTPVDVQLVRTGFNIRKSPIAPVDQTVYEAYVRHPVQLAPGQTTTFNYKFYFGPKSETILKQFSQYSLNEAIDYGFFKIVARPLYYILSFLHSIVQNWGIAIIVLTIFINIVFLPLQIKAYGSAQKMQKVQPELKLLQEKYKEDKLTLQKETMALMSKAGVNPLSGCLPLLPQLPVFFGLDSALRHTFDLRQSPFFFWIHDLTLHDPYFVLPVLMAVLMIGYQKMIPMPSMDPTQAKIMKFLPILFSIFMVFYPSGLALYVITNTVVSMIRQNVLMKRYAQRK